jgi:hypothetical protein
LADEALSSEAISRRARGHVRFGEPVDLSGLTGTAGVQAMLVFPRCPSENKGPLEASSLSLQRPLAPAPGDVHGALIMVPTGLSRGGKCRASAA